MGNDGKGTNEKDESKKQMNFDQTFKGPIASARLDEEIVHTGFGALKFILDPAMPPGTIIIHNPFQCPIEAVEIKFGEEGG